MATHYGNWAGSGNKAFRLIIDLWTENDSDTTVTIRQSVKVECKYKIYDVNNTFSVWGDIGAQSGSARVTPSKDWQTVEVYSASRQVTKQYGRDVTYTSGASLSGIEYVGTGAKSTVAASITVSKRHYQRPQAPGGASATRQSDRVIALTWVNLHSTNYREADYAENIYIYRSQDGAAAVEVAKLPNNTQAWQDTTVQPGHSYRYELWTRNSSYWSQTSDNTQTVYTTPDAPSNVRAVKNGSSVTVTWQGSATTYNVYTKVGSAARQKVATVSAKTYTHSTPPAGAVIYSVEAAQGGLISAETKAPPVVTVAPPNAPVVTVDEFVFASELPLKISWQHQAVDYSAQTAAFIRIGTKEKTLATQTSTTLTADDLGFTGVQEQQVQIQVYTRGAHRSWSKVTTKTVTIAPTPTFAFSAPARDGFDITALPYTATVDFSSASSRVRLLNIDFSIEDKYGRRVFSSKTNARTLQLGASTYVPTHGETYTIRAKGNLTNGKALSASRTFRAQYTPPAAPIVAVTHDDQRYVTQILVSRGTGSSVSTQFFSVYRVHDGQEKLLAQNVAHNATVTDFLPPLGVEYAYKVVAHATSGAVAITQERTTFDAKGAFVWSFGNDVFALQYNLSYSNDIKQHGESIRFAGRDLPEWYAVQGLDVDISVSGTFMDDAKSLYALSVYPHASFLRTPNGERYRVKAEVNISQNVKGHASASIKNKRLHWIEV